MKDAIRRAAIRAGRTFGQSFIGTVMTMGILQGVAADGTMPAWDTWEKMGIAAAASGVIAVLSLAQNALEDVGDVTYDRG